MSTAPLRETSSDETSGCDATRAGAAAAVPVASTVIAGRWIRAGLLPGSLGRIRGPAASVCQDSSVSGEVDAEVRALYRRILAAWNAADGRAFAEPFADDGQVIGFDGSLVASRGADGWRVALYQNTPAQFHGQPAAAAALTEELRREIATSSS